MNPNDAPFEIQTNNNGTANQRSLVYEQLRGNKKEGAGSAGPLVRF
jgi:hypothetical protein